MAHTDHRLDGDALLGYVRDDQNRVIDAPAGPRTFFYPIQIPESGILIGGEVVPTAKAYDERELQVADGDGEILVTDEQLKDGKIVGIGITDQADFENHYAYVELTASEAATLVDELNRRLAAAAVRRG